jgi:poly-gamma-glutamate capsule biosynthesis protein CapA/YwtB (metallophosphatase superfamily)
MIKISSYAKLDVIFFIIAIFAFLPCGIKASNSGPLLIQTHFTSILENLSSKQAIRILSGKFDEIKSLHQKNGKISIYVDRRIAHEFQKEFPDCIAVYADFDAFNFAGSDRSFLAFSDIRGLKPWNKCISIDAILPWGAKDDDYVLNKSKNYPLMKNWCEPWIEDQHLSIVQTGVTAMTRAFIPAVEKSGDLFMPIRYVKSITKNADIATTSNEVSFLNPCEYPLKNNLLFCSPLRYFEILKEAGFDVIELTGNHNNDFGCKYSLSTIDLIQNSGMLYYGGGRNDNDAYLIRNLHVKKTNVSFVGFNEYGPEPAFADKLRAGAAKLSSEIFIQGVKRAAENAQISIIAVQWGNENNPRPDKKQIEYSRRAADLGATITISSSAHRAMGIEYYKGKFISYGLGNFLFDQMQSISHRRGVIARHHFYRQKHISTELIPYIIDNYSQPRLLKGTEGRSLLEEIFSYSLGVIFK